MDRAGSGVAGSRPHALVGARGSGTGQAGADKTNFRN